MLNTHPSNEPLLTALGGPTGLKHHLEEDLDQWTTHNVTPFFVFDGQSITGQDEVTLKRGREAVEKTNIAWEMYFNNRAEEAVSAFGAIEGMLFPSTEPYGCFWLT
ncbi:hypothetical protein B0H66DRAFT_155395 [Apodospora peruviana]|uniref:XPG N-terminal domain-containing protein n=1 Tax=Apodospora peruviana TaxID=516989 RepID=A0AAE0IJT9_9PEZI|nr:hypothetical protein B0H66DRAFT_155395 [Apodospora peruviana]